MDEERKELIHFAQTAAGLDDKEKIKLILFAAGVKPATFFTLKINPKNIQDKAHTELHLQACKTIFSAGRPRAYEEITEVKDNAVRWRIKGSWYGYDIFKDKGSAMLFKRYLTLVRSQKHEQADRVAGRLYGYPRCCVERYIKEHNPAFLREKYTNYSYYQHLHKIERAFPLVMHTACSERCNATRNLNARYAATLKKHAPKFWKQFSVSKRYKTDVVVDSESELTEDFAYRISSTNLVFPAKDGHEYALITLKPIEKRHYLLSYLGKKAIVRGTVFPASVTIKYNIADTRLGRPKQIINDLHHERHFVLP